MGTSAPPTLRTPLILVALVNLAILGMWLWPWPEVLNLPGNGTTGFDPAISLLGYIGLVLWITSNRQEAIQKALPAGAMVGLLAGFILVAEVMLEARSAGQPGFLQPALLGAAGIVWGIAGLRGSRATGNARSGMLSGAWSAMVSCLMACTAIFAEMCFAGPPPEMQDPWQQYQGLAIGNPETQALVHSLNTATGFLLIGPLVGAAVGQMFAFFERNQKS
jgi:hypothetical protein